MKNRLIILLMLVGIQVFSQGMNISLVSSLTQSVSVAGTVLDAQDTDEKLVFAEVSIKELDLQIETDMEGAFSFQLSPGSYTLEVAFIGYEAQEILLEVVRGEMAQEMVHLQPLRIQSAQLIEPIEPFQF
ncbi:MAG: hypothetical protein COB60_05170 [Flavobacteriaceae bacterium]|nr:MAG: hypothetical protein COB60_05170 [Flavobacteriaceae bacterium]